MTSNTLKAAVFALFGAMVVSGCRCGDVQTTKQFGEIGVVYEADGSTRTDREAVYDFGSVFMGQSVDKTIVIKNLGAGSLTLSSLEYSEGDQVKVGDNGDDAAPWHIQFEPGTTLGASEYVEVKASFIPPTVDETSVNHSVKLVLRAENARDGEETATITLQGRAVSGQCELPRTIDFGNVAIDDSYALGFTVHNPTEIAANAQVGDVTSSSGDDQAFVYTAESPRGDFTIDPQADVDVNLEFHPTEKKSYLAFVKARASEQCPEQNITLTGNGVDQVLSWVPAQVNCGYVTPGVEVQKDITFTNDGNADADVFDIATQNTTEFYVVKANDGDLKKLSVPGKGGTATLTVACKPAVLGPRQTQLKFSTTLPKQGQGTITLKTFGGGPDIDVKPSPNLNFGKVAYFAGANPPSFASRKLTVMNVGTAPAVADVSANLHLGTDDGSGNYALPYVEVTPLNADTATDEFTVSVPATYDPTRGLEAKVGLNAADLTVTVTPKSIGMKQAEIAIHSNDPDEPVVKITVSANAVVMPPCNYSVTPTALNFGLISPPDYRDLAFTITNNGTAPTDTCILSGLDLGAGTDAAFSLVDGPIDNYEMQPGEQKEIKVRVWPQGQTPTSVSNISGTVSFFMSSPTKPSAAVTLSAQLAPSCLTIAPDDLDFGTVQIGCSSATRTFNIYNTCSQNVTISNFTMQAAAGQPAGGPNCTGGTACPEFTLVQSPAIPSGGLVMAPGSNTVTFQAKYKPIDSGSDTGAIAISASQGGSNVTYVVALHGKGDSQGIQTDVYTQDAKPKADILMVIDNSGSMGPYQTSLSTNFDSFINYADSAKVDYHIAVVVTEAPTSAGGSNTDYAKFVFGPTHPEKVLTPTTVNVKDKFKAKVNVGTCCGTEWEADPALTALTPPLVNSDNSGFLRNDAALAVVALTDEPDQSPQTASYYLNGFWNIKGFSRKTMFTFNAIAGFSPACKAQVFGGDSGELAFYVTQTNGVMDDICTPDWSKTLQELGKSAFGFRTNFFLTSVPDLSKGPIEVRIDGTLIDSTDIRGATVWTYDSVGNSLNFEPMYVPEPGQTLEITYHTTCYP